MQTDFPSPLKNITRWVEAPEQTERRALQELASQDRIEMLLPQLTWVLVGLIHFRSRQQWAWEALAPHLSHDITNTRGYHLTLLIIHDAMQRDPTGAVPGLSEWNFGWDGSMTFIQHHRTEERLYLDTMNGPESVSYFYYGDYLRRHREPGPAEQRVLEFFPNGKGLAIPVHHLIDDDLVQNLNKAIVEMCDFNLLDFTLSDSLDCFADPVETFLDAWDQRLSPGLAAVIGDWDLVRDLAEATAQSDLGMQAARQADAAHRQWLSLLKETRTQHGLCDDLLHAMAQAQSEDVDGILADALATPALAATAAKIVGGDPRRRPEVERLIERTRTDQRFYDVRIEAAFALAQGGADVAELIEELLIKPGLSNLETALCLAFEFRPEFLLPLLQWGLSCRTSEARLLAAAILAQLNSFESQQVLWTALDRGIDHETTIECRAALRECGGIENHYFLQEWEQAHPESASQEGNSARGFYQWNGGIQKVLRKRITGVVEQVDQIRDLIT